MPKPKETICNSKPDDSNRHQWISVAAYFKYEARGFEQGKDLDDWLEAEIEYIECQVQSFILRCEEDGGMSINSLHLLAHAVGVINQEHINAKVELIREIQKAAQHRPCFRSSYQKPCTDPESKCHWRSECHKLIAIWQR